MDNTSDKLLTRGLGADLLDLDGARVYYTRIERIRARDGSSLGRSPKGGLTLVAARFKSEGTLVSPFGGRAIATAVALCSVRDEFNRELGKRIAMNTLKTQEFSWVFRERVWRTPVGSRSVRPINALRTRVLYYEAEELRAFWRKFAADAYSLSIQYLDLYISTVNSRTAKRAERAGKYYRHLFEDRVTFIVPNSTLRKGLKRKVLNPEPPPPQELEIEDRGIMREFDFNQDALLRPDAEPL